MDTDERLDIKSRSEEWVDGRSIIKDKSMPQLKGKIKKVMFFLLFHPHGLNLCICFLFDFSVWPFFALISRHAVKTL